MGSKLKSQKESSLIDWWLLDTNPSANHTYKAGFFLATLAGLLGSFAFHPAHYWPLLFVSIALLFKLNEDGTTNERIFINLVFGFAFQLFTFIWIGAQIDSWTWFVELFLQTSFFLVLSFTEGALAFATSWVLLEFVSRSFPFEQFQWKRLGTVLSETPLDFLIPVIGTVGVTFLFVLIIGWAVNYKFSGLLMAMALMLLISNLPISISEIGNMNLAMDFGKPSPDSVYKFQYVGGAAFALWLFFLNKARRAFRR